MNKKTADERRRCVVGGRAGRGAERGAQLALDDVHAIRDQHEEKGRG